MSRSYDRYEHTPFGKLALKNSPHRHRGLAYYDKQRIEAKLPSIIGTLCPLSPETQKWLEDYEPKPAATSGCEETGDYTLRPCFVKTETKYRKWTGGRWLWETRNATCKWELRFPDGSVFRFNNRQLADAALTELLKIRRARPHRPKFELPPANPHLVFFTYRRMPVEIETEKAF